MSKRGAGHRNDRNPKASFAVSYLRIRKWVGVLGFALPSTLFLLDRFTLKAEFLLRGSLSAYYHSGARDVFVGVLFITGFMLIVYMAGQRADRLDTRESILSTVAGSGALLVALFPTKRPPILDSPTLCGPDAFPVPPGCTRLQQLLGETPTAWVHYLGAGVFILSLALICLLVFAEREEAQGNLERRRLHLLCGWGIVAAVVWILVGSLLEIDIFGWTPLLVGEVISVYLFSFSWIVRSYDLLPRPISKGLRLLRVA